jgi:hypothetical protein
MARIVSRTLACLLALVLPACQEDTPTTPAMSATCEARPATGPVPLVVSFLLNISGAQGTTTVAISYGDGQSGTNPSAPHTYSNGGSYTASFDVTTSTQSARCSAVVTATGTAGPSGGNKPPNAVFKVSPGEVGGRVTGKAPFTVNFNMCPTSDPEGDELYFLFDFDGNGTFDFGGITGFHCRADRTYAVGTYKPEICVHDRNAARIPLHDDICATYTIDATP